MKRQQLFVPVERISVKHGKHQEHATSLGALLFPEVKNPTGTLLDLLSKAGRS